MPQNRSADRFLAYLNDLVADRLPEEWEPAHSYPVSEWLRFKSLSAFYGGVGRLESIAEDWDALQELAGTPTAMRTAAEALPRKAHHYRLGRVFDYDEQTERTDDVERRVCAVYDADFACFGYELPAACKVAQGRHEKLARSLPGWVFDERSLAAAGWLSGCPEGQRNAGKPECLDAVAEAVSAAAGDRPLRGLKVVDEGAESRVPSGCSYSRASQMAIFNSNASGFSHRDQEYQLVCRANTN